MFPEIARDEVFRLETRRLWLRWPTMRDAFDAANAAALDAAGPGVRRPGAACIAGWRAANECGEALHLVLEDKQTRDVIGSLHLTFTTQRQGALDCHLVPGRRGQGLMTEAVQAVVHMAFLLDAATAIAAFPPAGDAGGRGVFERCGFSYAGTVMRRVAADREPELRDRFEIDRRTRPASPGAARPGGSPRRLPPRCVPLSMSV